MTMNGREVRAGYPNAHWPLSATPWFVFLREAFTVGRRVLGEGAGQYHSPRLNSKIPPPKAPT
jgi:hypothetical protein